MRKDATNSSNVASFSSRCCLVHESPGVCIVKGAALNRLFNLMSEGEMPNFLDVMSAISDLTDLVGRESVCLDCY